MLFGVTRKSLAIFSTLFFVAFVGTVFAHLLVTHEHVHETTQQGWHISHYCCLNENTFVIAAIVAIVSFIIRDFFMLCSARLLRINNNDPNVRAGALFRFLFSQGILHPKTF